MWRGEGSATARRGLLVALPLHDAAASRPRAAGQLSQRAPSCHRQRRRRLARAARAARSGGACNRRRRRGARQASSRSQQQEHQRVRALPATRRACDSAHFVGRRSSISRASALPRCVHEVHWLLLLPVADAVSVWMPCCSLRGRLGCAQCSLGWASRGARGAGHAHGAAWRVSAASSTAPPPPRARRAHARASPVVALLLLAAAGAERLRTRGRLASPRSTLAAHPHCLLRSTPPRRHAAASRCTVSTSAASAYIPRAPAPARAAPSLCLRLRPAKHRRTSAARPSAASASRQLRIRPCHCSHRLSASCDCRTRVARGAAARPTLLPRHVDSHGRDL